MRKAKKLLAGILAAVVTMTGTGVSFMADNVAVVYAVENPTLTVTSEAKKNDAGAFLVDFEKGIRLTAAITDHKGNAGTVDSISYEWYKNGQKVSETDTYFYNDAEYKEKDKVTVKTTVVYKNNGVTTAATAETTVSLVINKKQIKPDDAMKMVPDFGTIYIKGTDVVNDADEIRKIVAGVIAEDVNDYGTYEVVRGSLVNGKESSITLKYTLTDKGGYTPAKDSNNQIIGNWVGNAIELEVKNFKVVRDDSNACYEAPEVRYLTVSGVDNSLQSYEEGKAVTTEDTQDLTIGNEAVKVYGTGNSVQTVVPCKWETSSDAISIRNNGTAKVTITVLKPVEGEVEVKVTPVYGKNSTTIKFNPKTYVDLAKVSKFGDTERVYTKSTAEAYLKEYVKAPFEVISVDGDTENWKTVELGVGDHTVKVGRRIAKTEHAVDATGLQGVDTVYSLGNFNLKITHAAYTDIKWPELDKTAVPYGTPFANLLKNPTQDWNGDGNADIEFIWQENVVDDFWSTIEGRNVEMDTDWRKLRVVARIIDTTTTNMSIPSDKMYKTDYAFTVVPAKLTATVTASGDSCDTEGKLITSTEYLADETVTLTATVPSAYSDGVAGHQGNFKVEWYKDGQKLENEKTFSCATGTYGSGKYKCVITLEKKDPYAGAQYDLSDIVVTSNEVDVFITGATIEQGANKEQTYGTASSATAKVKAADADGLQIVSYQSYYVAADGTKSPVQSYNVGLTAPSATLQCAIPADAPVGTYKVYFEVKVQQGGNVYTLKNAGYAYNVGKKTLSIAAKAIKVSNAIIGGKVSDAIIEYTGTEKDLVNKGVEFTIGDDINFDKLQTLKNVKVVATLKDSHNFALDTKDQTKENYYVDITVTKAPLTLAAKAANVTEDAKVVFELENVPAGIDAAKVVYTVTDKLGKVVTANADGSYPIGEYTVTPSYTLDSTAAAVSEVKPVASKLVVVAGHKSHKAESVSQKVIPATTESAGYTVDVCKDCDGKEIEGTKKVLCAAIDASSVATKFTTYNYTGAEVKPGIIVKSKTGRRISAANFDVTYKNNTEVGTASYTITFKGNYSGTLTGTFRIVPSGVAALKVVSGENGFTANWSESKGATGYQVVYKSKSCRTTMQMATDTTITVKDARIKAGEVVYVYVKGYKAEDGVQYTSKNWKRRGVKAL